ncbi:hypothetical protein Y1Q_0010282 [Alligator mississippiensis]|uniref:Uncharacterized protein n=1 Tax=Alligator mississippiensis TaxID=8496 RepID=A0A151MLA5_ALLMI|nr:hypothetical protein Y1Q_0010282 [Alligator mississippiensis]
MLGHVIMETDISSFLLGPAVIPLLPGCITVLVTLQIHQLMAVPSGRTRPAGRCLCGRRCCPPLPPLPQHER